MKKLISDYEDEKVDALIRKAVKEEADVGIMSVS